jgi:hypothetical protein
MNVRTGDLHGFSDEEATSGKFEVRPLPSMDFAQKALLDAQERYFQTYPEARTLPLVWNIERVGA